jgi:hypothetical protein
MYIYEIQADKNLRHKAQGTRYKVQDVKCFKFPKQLLIWNNRIVSLRAG